MSGFILLASLWGFSFFGYNFGPTSQTAVEITYDYYNVDGAEDHYTLDGGDTYQVASH